MNRITAFSLAAGFAAVLGCSSSEELPPEDPTTPSPELISTPDTPTGPGRVELREMATYRTIGAVSSKGHPLEYRFDFDAAGANDYTNWSTADTFTVEWDKAGIPVVKVQARCRLHPNVESDWSGGRQVTISVIPATEIVRAVNRYWINGTEMAEDIDIEDSEPDTVPYGSWVTVYFQGVDSTFDEANCFDVVNKCWGYQMRFDWASTVDPSSSGFVPWGLYDPVDTDPNSTIDSVSMNIGTVDYVISARAVDFNSVADPNPPTLPLVGNRPPTLDSFIIEDQDGVQLNPGDTISWNWWAPADSETVVQPPFAFLRKTFYFVIKATGHDHPLDASTGLSWRYLFEDAAMPGQFRVFGRSPSWVDGLTTTALCDTHRYVVDYDIGDVNGDEVFNNPPSWNNKTYNVTIRGRDAATGASFTQAMVYAGEKRPLNIVSIDNLAYESGEGNSSFHIRFFR